ncbi:MAG: threonine/serine dehydratase [Ruegeria sp.]
MDWTIAIRDARDRIAAHVVQTPIAALDINGMRVEIKMEHLQHTGSFKARGAFNTLLSGPVPEAGIVAASGGNHGAAVAFAARKLGLAAHVFVPKIAGPAKIELIRATGANLTVVEGEYASALEQARRFEESTGACQVHAYDAPATVAGQGTVLCEWEDQGLDADTILIAVGGGGLIGGALRWLTGRRKVVAVEPQMAPTLHAAREAGGPVDVDVGGIAANALGAKRIGSICYAAARDHGVECVLVTEAAIAEAQEWLWRNAHQLVEPAGATALAALLSGAYVPAAGERVAVLICGANVAPDPFAKGPG